MENKNPIVTIEMENGKEIKIELYPNIAPNTVKNFVSLVNEGYYNGIIFHRVIPGFMIGMPGSWDRLRRRSLPTGSPVPEWSCWESMRVPWMSGRR